MGNLFRMFITFFKIGAFTFGGGYAMLPLIRREVVDRENWVKENEFIDIIAVAQSLPGPVAVNSAVFIGYKLRGIVGAVSTTLGVVLPSVIIILVIAMFFTAIKGSTVMEQVFMGIRPAVVSLILIAAIQLLRSLKKNSFNIGLIIFSFVSIAFLNFHPILVIFIAGFSGLIKKYLGGRVREDS
jgi:chromate transporter